MPGEGSRGGKIIGHYKSGKAKYENKWSPTTKISGSAMGGSLIGFEASRRHQISILKDLHKIDWMGEAAHTMKKTSSGIYKLSKAHIDPKIAFALGHKRLVKSAHIGTALAISGGISAIAFGLSALRDVGIAKRKADKGK